jgi:hypothetical protein
MCCFSKGTGSVPEHVEVTNTRIFARRDGQSQVVVYAMDASIGSELAMILPLPVRRDGEGQQIEFLNLEHCPEFFRELAHAVSPPRLGAAGDASSFPDTPLPVMDVGVYDASWVPTVAEFARLDPRFRLPDGVWTELTEYADYGFAVFRLKPGRQSVHPMGFSFASRDESRLFFPTVHVHDGRVTPTAAFDHTLFYQRDTPALLAHLKSYRPYVERGGTEAERVEAMKEAGRAYGAWSFRRHQLREEFEDRMSAYVAAQCVGRVRFLDGVFHEDTDLLDRMTGIIEREWFIFQRHMRGEFPNRDVWIPDAVPAVGTTESA